MIENEPHYRLAEIQLFIDAMFKEGIPIVITHMGDIDTIRRADSPNYMVHVVSIFEIESAMKDAIRKKLYNPNLCITSC